MATTMIARRHIPRTALSLPHDPTQPCPDSPELPSVEAAGAAFAWTWCDPLIAVADSVSNVIGLAENTAPSAASFHVEDPCVDGP